MQSFFKKALFLAAILSLFVIGCKKDKTEEPEFDTQTSQDNALAEGTFNDIGNMALQAIDNGNSLSTYRGSAPEGSFLSNCATVTLTPDTAGSGGTVLIDFGSSNCLCSDLRYRRGSVTIHFTGAYRDSGTVITHTFDNYFVGKNTTNMFKVTGSKTVTNMGRNTSGNLVFKIEVDGHLTNSANATMNWLSTRYREWIAGESTTGLTGWTDDVYRITGSASGVNFEGTSYTANISSALEIALDCRYIRRGVFELTPSGKPTRKLDFGNGDCDSLATITVNGTTFDVVLR